MADREGKTEQPTGRRLEKAREEGQVSKSMEMNTCAVLLTAILTLYFVSGTMYNRLAANLTNALAHAGQISVEGPNAITFLLRQLYDVGLIVAPLFIAIPAIGLLANVMQVGIHFTPRPLVPKLDKLNFIKGFERLFSMRSVAELVKSVVKILIIGYIAYATVRDEVPTIMVLGDMDVASIGQYAVGLAFEIFLKTCWIMVVLAILDYLFQKWKFTEDMKMTKEEVKEEFKQSEGDPIVKQRIRSIQREMARKRMLANVPKADVVVTNPTHLAVAMLYDAAKAEAPLVVAKGQNLVAERIKTIAREHGVPIMENKPLARSLFKSVEVGQVIPVEMYQAVAEILSAVYRLKGKVTRG